MAIRSMAVVTIPPVNTTALFPLTAELDENLWGCSHRSESHPVPRALGRGWPGKLDTLDADLNQFASGRGKSQFMNANFLFDSVRVAAAALQHLGGRGYCDTYQTHLGQQFDLHGGLVHAPDWI